MEKNSKFLLKLINFSIFLQIFFLNINNSSVFNSNCSFSLHPEWHFHSKFYW